MTYAYFSFFAGFRKVYYGCTNDRFGGCGSVLSLHSDGCAPCGRLDIFSQLIMHAYTSQSSLYALSVPTHLSLFPPHPTKNGHQIMTIKGFGNQSYVYSCFHYAHKILAFFFHLLKM